MLSPSSATKSETDSNQSELGNICRTITQILELAEQNPKIQQRVISEFRALKGKYTDEYAVNAKSEIDRRIKEYEKMVGAPLAVSQLEFVKSIVFPAMKKKFMEYDLVWKRSTNVRLAEVCAVLDKSREMWDLFFLEFDKRLQRG